MIHENQKRNFLEKYYKGHIVQSIIKPHAICQIRAFMNNIEAEDTGKLEEKSDMTMIKENSEDLEKT